MSNLPEIQPVQSRLQYIAVEGPIGVGKTTLARKLAVSLNADIALEEASQNPFLEQFYQAPEAMALPTQLHFLMTRRRAMRRVAAIQAQSPRQWVSDFLFQKDRLFAALTLDDTQFGLYSEIATELDFDLLVPDLVVYLQAPLDVLYERIEKRGVASEQAIASNYIARLQKAYTRFFHNYTDTPVLIVNAAEIDFSDNEHDYKLLLNQIMTVKAGRHYFNPSPELA